MTESNENIKNIIEKRVDNVLQKVLVNTTDRLSKNLKEGMDVEITKINNKFKEKFNDIDKLNEDLSLLKNKFNNFDNLNEDVSLLKNNFNNFEKNFSKKEDFFQLLVNNVFPIIIVLFALLILNN